MPESSYQKTHVVDAQGNILSSLGGGSGGGDASAINQQAEIARLEAIRDRLPTALGSGGGIKVEVLSGSTSAGPADFTETNTRLGAVTEPEAQSVSASSGLNGLIRLLISRFTTTANGLKIDGSAAVQPVSGSVSVGNFPPTQTINAATLPLPTGAATEITLSAMRDRTPALGQATAALSVPVALSSDGPFSLNFGVRADAAAATDTAVASFLSLFKRFLVGFSSLVSLLPTSLSNGRFRTESLFIPSSGTLINRSGSLAVANTAQQVAPANPNRKYLLFQNNSTGTLWINFGTGAVQNQPSIKLLPNSGFAMEHCFVSTESLSVIGSVVGETYTYKEA